MNPLPPTTKQVSLRTPLRLGPRSMSYLSKVPESFLAISNSLGLVEWCVEAVQVRVKEMQRG